MVETGSRCEFAWRVGTGELAATSARTAATRTARRNAKTNTKVHTNAQVNTQKQRNAETGCN